MKTLGLMAILNLVVPQHYGPSPPIEPQVYSDTATAAIEGLRQGLLINDKRDVEYGGVVVELPGHLYRISMPRTDNKLQQVEMPRASLGGYRIVADFHMHVCAHNEHSHVITDKFSPADIAGNNAFHTEGYLLDGCLGTIYRYNPAHKELDPAKGPQRGEVVGWLKEIAE